MNSLGLSKVVLRLGKSRFKKNEKHGNTVPAVYLVKFKISHSFVPPMSANASLAKGDAVSVKLELVYDMLLAVMFSSRDTTPFISLFKVS